MRRIDKIKQMNLLDGLRELYKLFNIPTTDEFIESDLADYFHSRIKCTHCPIYTPCKAQVFHTDCKYQIHSFLLDDIKEKKEDYHE